MHRMRGGTVLLLFLCAVAAVCAAAESKDSKPERPGASYLLVWGGDEAHQQPDFLAIIDAQPGSPTYGKLIKRIPVSGSGMMPHHTEYEFPASGILFANAWAGGRTYIFDVRDPASPKVRSDFTMADGYGFPHSFVRLPNGNVLATFQSHQAGYAPAGGLVEMDDQGKVIRSASAVTPALKEEQTWPYSMAVVPAADRVVVSNTPMGIPKWAKTPAGSWSSEKVDAVVTQEVQIWRLSDLKPLHMLALPRTGEGDQDRYPAEPRLLPDGSVYVNTFQCGLYRVTELASDAPKVQFIRAFPGGKGGMEDMCAVPVLVGKYWIQTVGALPGLIALDISDPAKPVEASRITFDHAFHMPHWIAADRNGNRLVVTGVNQDWLQIVNLDPRTGKMSLDEKFRSPGSTSPGVHLAPADGAGTSSHAQLHGALFIAQ